jgi:programmed cell death 6-interacting protein
MVSALHVMLAVHCKKTEQLDLKGPVLSYIKGTYSNAEAEEATDDLVAIQALRNEMVTAQGSAAGAKRDTLVRRARQGPLLFRADGGGRRAGGVLPGAAG